MKPIILPPNPERRAEQLQRLVPQIIAAHPGRPIRLRWELARPDKTDPMNRYLWAVPYAMLVEATGMEAEEIHEWNCGHQWGWKDRRCPITPRNPQGVESVPIRSTTRDEHGDLDNCSQDEMRSLWRRAQQLGANLGVVIPDPDPDYWKA